VLTGMSAQPPILPPPLKWAGGKRWLVPYLLPWWAGARGRRFVEPFCGGLAMALGVRPAAALLNDMNPHLINFYRWLQRGLVIPFPMTNERHAYDAARARFNALIRAGEHDTEEAAGLFYYLNRTGFNGLCRFNRRGEFNVPFGRYSTIRYVTDFTPYQAALAGWTFTTGDFAALSLDADDVVYADPPYDVEFVSYSKEGFTWADQVRLAEWLAALPNPVILSNQATERIIALYSGLGFHLEITDAPRRISSTGDRSPAKEVIAFRNCSAAPFPV
jgi:DNA adenine methylase